MNSKIFKKRLRWLYTNWKKHKHRVWGGSDVLVISTDTYSSNSTTISNRFHLSLFRYIFLNTITIFTFTEIHFICNHHNSSLLKDLTSSSKEAVGAHVVIHENDNGDDPDPKTIVKQILSELQNQHDCPLPLTVGHVAGESLGLGLEKNEFEIVDINNGLSKFVANELWGFKQNGDEGDFHIYLQELSKEAVEKILLADVKRVDMNTLTRRRKKVEDIGQKDEFDDVSEWVLV